jgi:Amidase
MKFDKATRPWQLPLVVALEQMRRGELTSVQWVRSCLKRIDDLDGTVEAWAWLDAGRAQRHATAADQRRQNGAAAALPLNGVPVGVKDIIRTREMPTEMGSPIFAGHRPQQDAAIVDRIRVHARFENAQPVESSAYAGRFVRGIRRVSCGGVRSRCPRYPDQWFGHPSGGILRHRRIQTKF